MNCRLSWIIGASTLTLINLGTLAATVKASAEPAGMDYRGLERVSGQIGW